MRTRFSAILEQGRQASENRLGFRQTRTGAPSQRKIGPHPANRMKLRWPVALFVFGLAWPCSFFIGSLRLSLYRIILLVMILPCLGRLISGKAGRIKAVDIVVLLFSFWCVLSLVVNNGIEASAQTSGIFLLETVGPYLLARCYVRDADAFYNLVQLLFGIVCFLLPFAIIEFVSGLNILHEICPLPFGVMAERYGLTRVQSVFDHPILFGVFTGSIFAMAYLVLGYQESIFMRTLRIGIIGATTLLSLSAGPIIAVIAQVFFLSWNSLLRTIKYRWTILICLLVLSLHRFKD